MSVLYKNFEMPQTLTVEDGSTATFGRVVAEPFENGFGHTVGNCLRRVLLSSIEAPGLISFGIEGVTHEYTAIDGVVEDMIHIALNMKGVLLRLLPDQNAATMKSSTILKKTFEVTQEMLDQGNGNYKVLLRDVIDENVFEVVNPDHYLFTATKPMKREFTIRVAISRGFVPSEQHVIEERFNDEILLDTIFSPVRLVNYFVESTRVGKNTDYDRLILEITTDGRITPKEALTFTAQISASHFDIFSQIEDKQIVYEKEEDEDIADSDEIMQKLVLRISDIEFSVRASNCLMGAEIDTIAELVIKPEAELLKFRNFGKKSLNEIKAKLLEMGLHLGMDLSPFGITRENIREAVAQYNEQRVGVK